MREQVNKKVVKAKKVKHLVDNIIDIKDAINEREEMLLSLQLKAQQYLGKLND